MTSTPKPIRFGIGANVANPKSLIESARAAEALGFSTLAMNDHFASPFAPLTTLQAVLAATTTLRVTQTVLNHDFRHPAVLAKELATMDVLSGGRVEIGLGAGWMAREYEQTGIAFDAASTRIARLEEYVMVLKGLFSEGPFTFEGKNYAIHELDGQPKPMQKPHPPIMIGGGGKKLLSLAARHADIVALSQQNRTGTLSVDADELTEEAYEQKVAWVREAAGSRFDDLEIQMGPVTFMITEDRAAAIQAAARGMSRLMKTHGGDQGVSEDVIAASPLFVIGTLDEVCDRVLALRERFHINYFSAGPMRDPTSLAPVMERLNGT